MNYNPTLNKPIERAFSLQFAENELIKALDSLGYKYEYNFAGETIYTCKCTISEKISGNVLSSGNGKGELNASRVGSLFEATEHLFSLYDFIPKNKISYFDSLTYCQNNSTCNELPLAILKNYINKKIPFLKYKAVNGKETKLYPLALSCPSYIDTLIFNKTLKEKDSFDYSRLEQYSSNSGTAIGMNREEAIIHGLLENIERTSLSKFLTKTFVLNEKKHLQVIDSFTLPRSIRNLLNKIEKEIDSKVIIFKMPNKFGIPVFCSWMERYEFQVGITGYGCSLSTEHAISRSLYEVAQCYLLGHKIYGLDWRKKFDDDILNPLNGLKFHQECAKFDLGSKCKELEYNLINYKKIPKLKFSKETKKYLSELTQIIYSKGEIPYACELNTIGKEINISHTYITGEDRFFNVTQGKTTFPKGITTTYNTGNRCTSL